MRVLLEDVQEIGHCEEARMHAAEHSGDQQHDQHRTEAAAIAHHAVHRLEIRGLRARILLLHLLLLAAAVHIGGDAAGQERNARRQNHKGDGVDYLCIEQPVNRPEEQCEAAHGSNDDHGFFNSLHIVFLPFCRRFCQLSIFSIIFSCVASARVSSPLQRPSCSTNTRSDMPSISGISEEIIMMALPCSLS